MGKLAKIGCLQAVSEAPLQIFGIQEQDYASFRGLSESFEAS
jgi:hypothetical protein